ncbi:unnamed protein product [Somion occarium]|uniref:O-fucosyltransferase family protein n=1 Tax=Somion occarium TaxID=3059160 RepID=A0ABP1ECW2_9APHY
MLRSRPGRQAGAYNWPHDFSPETTPSQRNISWKELEESPKRLIMRRSHEDFRFSSWRRTRRLVYILCIVTCCFLLFWLFASRYSNLRASLHLLRPIEPVEPVEGTVEGTVEKPTSVALTQDTFATTLDEPPLNDNRKEAHITDTRKVPWPPMVTAIPETRPDPEALYSGLTVSSVDSQFCGVSPCRILLPLWIGEQESRSRMHLVQVLQLARALNRTLVLPNVGRSRIGACGRWDFEVYYDVGSFVGPKREEDLGRVRKVMLMDDFRTWLEMRPTGPKGQLLFVDEKTDVEEDASREKVRVNGSEALSVYADKDILDLEDPRLRKVRCLSTKYRQLQLDASSPMTVHLPPVDSFGGQFLADAFTQDETFLAARRQFSAAVEATPEVLILHWDTRHFPYPHLLESMSLDYSSKVHALARKLVQPRIPYLAIHWRMETVIPALLPDCAEALVDTVVALLSDPNLASGIKTVWFASDFPWPISSGAAAAVSDDVLNSSSDGGRQQNLMQIASSARRSNTFRSVSHEHIEAIGIFTAAFRQGGTLADWRLTGVSEELDRVRKEMEREGKGYVLEEDDDEGVLLEDSGVLGILDKLAAMNAALFVSGAKRCGRVSSFTKQITDHRGAKSKKDNAPRNIADIFG